MSFPKNTLIVTSEYNEGPISRHYFALYREMAKMGWYIILLIDQKKVAVPYTTDEGLVIKNWPSPRATTWQDALFLAKLIRQKKPLAVIGTFGSVNISVLVSFLFGVPNRVAWYCTSIQAQKLNYRGSKYFFNFLFYRKKWIYGFSNCIISLSRRGLNEFANYFGSKQAFIQCNRLIPDPELQVAPGSTKICEKLVITFIGTFTTSKDPLTPIEALAYLTKKYPDLKMYMIGDGPLLGSVKNLIQKYQLQDNLVLTGWLPHYQIFNHLSKSLANMCTSLSEVMTKVNLQALGMSVPIITTRVNGAIDALKEGYNGYGIEPKDEQTAASRVHELLANPKHQQKLAKQARKDFEDRFMLENNVADQAQKLSEFLSNKP